MINLCTAIDCPANNTKSGCQAFHSSNLCVILKQSKSTEFYQRLVKVNDLNILVNCNEYWLFIEGKDLTDDNIKYFQEVVNDYLLEAGFMTRQKRFNKKL